MNPLDWRPPAGWTTIETIDAHTAGEPFRVILGGIPEPPGATVLERRAWAERHLDDLRRLLMWEPRGHADMYGGLVVPPADPDADLGILFLHNAGFSTMCGHGIIALVTVLLETGWRPAREPETELVIETPAGTVRARARVSGGRVLGVAFTNVPSFVLALDRAVEVPALGSVPYDLAFGGAFYAYVRAADVGLELDPGGAEQLVAAGRAIRAAVAAAEPIEHPDDPRLGFLYGVVFVGPAADPAHDGRNVCVFAEGELDRSPTGTGVSGRLAIHHARGELATGDGMVIESVLGTCFEGRVLDTTRCGPRPAIVAEIAGTAHLTGRHTFCVDPGDPLGAGFLVR